jgi:hypothetical protein
VPADVRGELNHALRRSAWFENVNDNAPSSAVPVAVPVSLISSILDDLVKRSRACEANIRSSGTNPGHTHLHYVVSALKQLWSQVPSSTWTTNYRSWPPDKPTHSREFVEPAPLFVQRVMKAIDPEIPLDELQSAMEFLDRKAAGLVD